MPAQSRLSLFLGPAAPRGQCKGRGRGNNVCGKRFLEFCASFVCAPWTGMGQSDGRIPRTGRRGQSQSGCAANDLINGDKVERAAFDVPFSPHFHCGNAANWAA